MCFGGRTRWLAVLPVLMPPRTVSVTIWPAPVSRDGRSLDIAPVGSFFAGRLAAEHAVEHGRQVAIQEERRNHAADHHDGQRTLGLGADTRGKSRRHQSEDRGQPRSS
jgi:hypothetical protein